ncbi:MAG: hypothetical protein WCK21_08935 [Actinomycetota bacterium]
MIKRFVLAGSVLAAVATFGLAVPTHATGVYPPGGSTGTTKVDGTKVVISADVCPAGQGLEVTFTITPPGGGAPTVLKDVADALGHAEVQYTITLNGTYTVQISLPEAECAPSSSQFASEALLPRAGSDSSQWLVTGTALVLTGAGFTVVAMRRRRHAAA